MDPTRRHTPKARITAQLANENPYGMLGASLLDVPNVVPLYGASEFAC